MTQLIALVATAVMVAGERVLVQPGELLPALSVHDATALLESGAAADRAAEAAQAAAQARQQQTDQAGFDQARERVRQEAASIAEAAPAAADGDGDTVAAPKPKKPAKE